jgi:hypothetical protein
VRSLLKYGVIMLACIPSARDACEHALFSWLVACTHGEFDHTTQGCTHMLLKYGVIMLACIHGGRWALR